MIDAILNKLTRLHLCRHYILGIIAVCGTSALSSASVGTPYISTRNKMSTSFAQDMRIAFLEPAACF